MLRGIRICVERERHSTMEAGCSLRTCSWAGDLSGWPDAGPGSASSALSSRSHERGPDEQLGRSCAGGLGSRSLVGTELWYLEIGRASCRERGCQYVSISVVAVYLKKKNIEQT